MRECRPCPEIHEREYRALPFVERLGVIEEAAKQAQDCPDAAALDSLEAMLEQVFAALQASFPEALAGKLQATADKMRA